MPHSARPRPEIPQALHLGRLAQASPGEWVRLPGGELRVVLLQGKLAGEGQAGWLLCLSGEAVIDLPLKNFVRLRPAEGYRMRLDEPWTAFDTKADTTLLLVADAAGSG